MTDPAPQPSDAATPATPASGSAGARLRPPSVAEMNAALPQFEFVELIGAGGMGAVYKARQPKLNRFVAIKMLPPRTADDLPGFSERFEREAQSMARLNHPHIVAVYDFGETAGGQSYFVMEYVEGADLERLIAGGQLTLDHFYGWIPQICEAIQYAHDRGIVHRDIKPANVLIDLEGRVKIADFGLAKLTGADKPETVLTQENLSMGTPDYASPEQIDGGAQVDWRSDIYSLGVLMYQMLTGRLPRGAFPMPSEKDPGLDPRLDEVVMRAMQSDPANRFQRASEISDRLTTIRTTPIPAPKVAPAKPAHPKPQPKPKPSRSRALPWVAGIAGVSLLAGIALAVVRSQGGADRSNGASRTNKSSTNSTHQKASTTPKAATQEKAPKPPKTPPPAETSPPRDFSRRPEGKEGAAKPPMEAFRDKLGTRAPFSERLEKLRRQQANLTVLSRDGAVVESDLANLPPSLKPVVAFAVGQSPPQALQATAPFAVALQFDGRVRIWGENTGALEPIPESTKGETTAIAAGARHVLALRRDGTVIAWGDNEAGQCEVPAGLSTVTAIAAGGDFSVALKADGTVVAWGASPGKDLPAGLANVKAITCGFGHALALKSDGTVTAWGVNRMGQTDVPKLEGATSIAATFGNSFALLKDGGVQGWGASGPDAAPPSKGIAEIYGSGEALIARDEDGRLILHLPGTQKPVSAPGFLRQLPRDMKIVISERLIFAYLPAELREPSATPEPEPAAPVTPPAPAPAPEPQKLTEAGQQIEDLKEKFQQAYLEQVSKPYEDSLRQLNAFYLNHLEERQTAAAAASKLEEAVAWRSEADRVRAGEPLPAVDDSALPVALIELRRTYREKAAQYEATRKTAEAGLLTKYTDALQAMQDRFTQEQKLDAALEVKAFREEQVATESGENPKS